MSHIQAGKGTVRRGISREMLANVNAPGSMTLDTLVDDRLPPMPEADVLDRQLMGVMETMNIPKDKCAELMNQPKEKKWQLVWGQMKAEARHPPQHYVDQLLVHVEALEKRQKRKSKSKKSMVASESLSSLLRSLEISLRTNSLQWVKEFLHAETKPDSKADLKAELKKEKSRGGLDVLMDYLIAIDEDGRENMDDYLCILCLRALMNNAYGFNSVMAHPESINQIVLCLRNVDPFAGPLDEDQLVRKYRTHVLVLELLAAVCLVPKGHSRILAAFNNFQKAMNEEVRFQTLVHLLRSERNHVGVMVACMAFINVVVHCVPDINYQVALQHEFTQLGLLPLVEELRKQELPDLTEQIDAYQDNFVNVAELAREAEMREQDLEHIEVLEKEIRDVRKEMVVMEAKHHDAMTALHKQLAEEKLESDALKGMLEAEKVEHHTNIVHYQDKVMKLKDALGAAVKHAEEVQQEKQRLQRASVDLRAQLESGGKKPLVRAASGDFGFGNLLEDTDVDSMASTPAATPEPSSTAATPIPEPPALPPPGLIPGAPQIPGAPPPPDLLGASRSGTMSKRRIKVDVKLPMLNWAPIAPHKIENTIFKELDDDSIIEALDFSEFKEAFQLRSKKTSRKLAQQEVSLTPKPKGPQSVLELNRARNLAISFRRVNPEVEVVSQAIQQLDSGVISTEMAELLRSEFIASPEELLLLDKQHSSGKRMAQIDEYLFKLSRVPRLRPRLTLLCTLDSCEELLASVRPANDAIISASSSLLASTKLRKLLEIILAFGNYMNSQRRGGVFGFKLSSFERLMDTKSADRQMNLLHYIVQTIKTKFPECMSFADDLMSLEAASAVSFVNLETDVQTLSKTAKAVKAEAVEDPENAGLQAFLENTEPAIAEVRKYFDEAKAIYKKVTTFFGEDPSAEPSSFFSLFVRINHSLKAADKENHDREERIKRMLAEQEQLAMESAGRLQELVDEDTPMNRAPREYRRRGTITARPEVRDVQDGTIDNIISDMKTSAYRRADNAYASARPWLK